MILLTLIRIFYITMTLTYLIATSDKALNALNVAILHYGRIDSNIQKDQERRLVKKTSLIKDIEQRFATLTLPKKWFKYFYLFGTMWVSLIILEVLILPAAVIGANGNS